jgi:hypothetical protein
MFMFFSHLFVWLGSHEQLCGPNKEGNTYRGYSDGSYTYKNTNAEGQTTGRYFDTSKGHAFNNLTAQGANRANRDLMTF